MNKVLALFLLLPSLAFCGDLRQDQLNTLKQVQTKLTVIKDLRTHKVINGDNQDKVDAVVASYYDEAKNAVGHSVTSVEIDALVSAAPATVAAEEAKSGGVKLFISILVVLAGALLIIALGLLAAYYLWPLFVNLPVELYELGGYALTAGGMLAAYMFHPVTFWVVTLDPLWLLVPSAFAFAGCVYASYNLHFKSENDSTFYAGPGLLTFPVVLSALCMACWGSLAVFYHSLFPAAGIPYFLAFISVMALQSCLGFSVISMPGCIAMGWSDDAVVARSTSASLMIMGAYVVAHISSAHLGASVELFRMGCLFMGAFVYYLGLLVMSSKWYSDGSQYAWMQIVTVISGMAAFAIGSLFGISILLGIGGTFFTIYLFEKYYEIPWSGIGWAWSALGFAIGIYFIVGFAAAHPAFFIWTM